MSPNLVRVLKLLVPESREGVNRDTMFKRGSVYIDLIVYPA